MYARITKRNPFQILRKTKGIVASEDSFEKKFAKF